MLDAFRDLVLGCRCVGCDRPGRLLCDPCRTSVPVSAAPAWPTPVPAGLVAPWAATSYDGTVRAMILGHKEHRLMSLARPLGELLAMATWAALSDLRPAPAAVLLVPVPSRAATTRRRGHDPTLALTRAGARGLAARGWDARCVRLLRARPGLADQSGLDATARAANLAGALRVDHAALRRLARAGRAVHVVVCDDVLTTGATAAEAQRALRSVGLPPLAAVAVAATRRRSRVLPPERLSPEPFSSDTLARSPHTG